MKLLDVLNNRYSIAKEFTDKNYTKEVKTCLEDYKCEKSKTKEQTGVTDKHLIAKRYELPIPYIYSTHESMLASLFEKPAELVISDKGKLDEIKAEKVKAAYKYLEDKLDLQEFLNNSGWWLILTGFVSSYQTYEMKIDGEEPVMDAYGQPMLDDMTGEPITQPTFEWNDPVAYVDDPFKTFFAPESEFTIKGDKLPYTLREKLVEKDELLRIYPDVKEDEIEENEKLEVDGYKGKDESDLMRAKAIYYCGRLPKELDDAPEGWTPDKQYFITFTKSKILNITEDKKKTTVAKWFGAPNSFFGFGIGKTLRTFQKEMSIRRGQQIRYADLYSFPKPILDSKTKVDQTALNSLGKANDTTPLIYNGNPPAYLTPPPLPQIMQVMDQTARSDAQFVSGTLDMSKGAQESNTVKTATGQQLFAQSQDKRIQKLRKALGKYYKYVVVNLLELARDNWDEEKMVAITDDEGNPQEVSISGNDLADIDFDTDIDIQLDTIIVNKDTLAQRSIDMYDKVKDDPLIDRKKVFSKTLKDGYSIKNPENYMLQEGQEGTQPTGNNIKDAAGIMANQQPTMDQGVTGTADPTMLPTEPNIPDLTQPPNVQQPLG